MKGKKKKETLTTTLGLGRQQGVGGRRGRRRHSTQNLASGGSRGLEGEEGEEDTHPKTWPPAAAGGWRKKREKKTLNPKVVLRRQQGT